MMSVAVTSKDVDCDAAPAVPLGTWGIVDHKPRGQIVFDLANFDLYLSPNQKQRAILGTSLEAELRDKPTENATLADFLLRYPDLYSSEWRKQVGEKTFSVFFWATKFRDGHGSIYIRCLTFDTGWVRANFFPLNQVFASKDFALIRKV